MALFEEITTEQQMVDYIKLKLGMPVINIEVTDDQFKQAIWDTIEDFRRYNYDEGSFMDHAIITFSAGQYELPVSAAYDQMTGQYLDNVQDIYDLGISHGLDGINTLFSPSHILLYDEYVNKGAYPGGPGTNYGAYGGLTLTNYQVAMMYIEEINNLYGKYYTLNYLPGRKTIRIIPTPSENITGVVTFYRKEYARHLYNHPLVKKLSIARAKIQWSRHLGKYGATLPDGITINYDALMQEGREDEEKYLEWMRTESMPIDFFIA